MGIFKDFLSQLSGKKMQSDAPNKTNEYDRKNKELIDEFCKRYDLSTEAGIRAIPIKEMQTWMRRAPGTPSHPEQILNRKATEYKRLNKMDLAIECLKKANEIYEVSDYIYSENDYLRLVRYLQEAGRFEEARAEQEKIAHEFGHVPNVQPEKNPMMEQANLKSISQAKELGTDLVEASWVDVCCETCGKYRGRVFSLSGKSKEFPMYPKNFCTSCGLICYPFIYKVSSPSHYTERELIKMNRKPFSDPRTREQIAAYEKQCRDKAEETKDRADFAWLQENLSASAPKSFGGYRRMKNSNSANYQKLKKQAAEKGKSIG